MKYDMNDIDHISDFSESLRAVCDDIKAGVPKSRACEKHGVSLTMFNKIMHGLRKTSGTDSITPPRPSENIDLTVLTDGCGAIFFLPHMVFPFI